MDAGKYVNEFPTTNQYLTAKDALNKISEIEILIEVITTRLVECRKLRLDAITSDEIRNLERKLIKQISQQLDAKQKVDPKESLSDLRRYPSLSNLLTLAGVSSSLIIAMKKQTYLVEELLDLTALKLDSAVRELGGSSEDIKKLLSALSVLRKFNGTYDGTNHSSRNGSESSGSNCSDAFSPSGGIHLDFPNATEQSRGPRRQHSADIPSVSSSSMTPPSPTGGSRSSMESDSAFASVRGQGSPPAKVAMHITPSTPSLAPLAPITPVTPRKSSQQHLQPSFDLQTANKNLSRDRFPSTGAKTAFSTSTPKLKSSMSTESYIGNPKESLAYGFGNMSGSCQSLGSNASHSSPSISKQTKANKKKKRPDFTVDTEKLDFITLLRSAPSRRGSSTMSPESLESPSPVSGSRTPSTPLTPDLNQTQGFFGGQQSVPGTPKTPKSNFKAFRKIFKMIGIGKKITRNKSSEHLADPVDHLPPVQRTRSGTMPSPKTNLMLLRHKKMPSSHPSSTCGTPLASPDLVPFANDDLDSSSRRTSLVDTDKTIVPDNGDVERDSTMVDGGGDTNDLSNEEASTLFHQGNVVQSEEWDIHYDDIKRIDKIGSGRVGTVYRGYWHADVAIRVIDVNYNEEEKLRAFKQEIAVFKKTRHENLELFMGFCMNPPHLAIVTGFCRGQSLYNYIRENKSLTSSINQVKIIAQHIVQGMGYLHSKEIVHKDLKSKNIFVDGKRVVITGFGLVGLHAVACDESRTVSGFLKIPEGWLCYLAPELIRSIFVPRSQEDDVVSTLPYTAMTDVYAFGTVWYELLAGSWPLQGSSSESIIWQVGSDNRRNINQVQSAKDVKDLLHQCWSFEAAQRPDFSDKGVMGCLKKLQTQMQRSLSSHPRRSGAPNRGHAMERMYDSSHLRQGSNFSTLHDLAE